MLTGFLILSINRIWSYDLDMTIAFVLGELR